MRIDPRLVAQITTQILKDTQDMTPNGDFMQCLKAEKEIRAKNNGNLPASYRYHLNRISEAAHLACQIIVISSEAAASYETT